ncbi:MAG: hypothetical protein ACI4F5_00660, partial [Acutalibacteraceae bacterium]
MKKELKKSLSILLTIVMIVSMIPTAIFTAGAAVSKTLTKVEHGLIKGGSSSRLNGNIFNIVNDGEADNTSAGIIKFDISEFASVTSATLNALVSNTPAEKRKTAYYYSYSVDSIYLGNAEHQVSGSFGGWYTGRNTLLKLLGISGTFTDGEGGYNAPNFINEIDGTDTDSHQFDITSIVRNAISNGNQYVYIIVIKNESGATGSNGGWTDTTVDASLQTITIVGEKKTVDEAITSFSYSSPITSNKGSWQVNNSTPLVFPDTITAVGPTTYTIFQNILYAGDANHDVASVSGSSCQGWMRHQPLVMLYDGVTAPRAPIMVVYGTSSKYNRFLYALVLSDNDSNSLKLTDHWHGSRDNSYGNNFDWLAAMNRSGNTDMLIPRSLSESSVQQNWRIGKSSTFDSWKTTPGLANMFQFEGSFASGVYTKTITPTVTAYVGSDETVKTTDIVHTLTSDTPVYVVNYKAVLDAINDAKTLINNGALSTNEIWKYTDDSVAAVRTAMSALIDFDPGSYSFADSSLATNVAALGNGIKTVCDNYYTAKKNLTKKQFTLTYSFADGTTKVATISAGDPVGFLPSNSSASYNNDKATHNTYKWPDTLPDNTTAFNYNTIIRESVTVTEELKAVVNCSFSKTESTAATCTENGSETYTCSVCNGSYTETFTALGHSYTSTLHSLDNGTHNWLCANGCGTYGTPQGGTGATVDCSLTYTNTSDTEHTKSCSDCGYSATENHIWVEDAENSTDPKGCEEAGKTVFNCICGATKEEIIPADPHEEVSLGDGYAATCTTPGKTDSYYCINCGEITREQEEIPATGHQSITKVEAVTPTCTTAGNIEYYVCGDCDTYFSDASATSEITDKNSVVIAANGHDWNDGEITTPANCVDTGVKTYTCNVCGDTRTEVIAVDSTNHKTVVTDVEVAPTCTATGLTEGSHCSACGTVIVEQTVINALGHAWGAWTYDNANKTHTRVCTRLGCSESQSGKCSFTSEVKKNATCLNAGTTLYTCSVCSGTYTEEIPQLDHDYSGPTKSNGDGTHSYLCKNGCAQYGGTEACSGGTATCIAKATCEVCGYGYGEFAEHAWDSGTVKTPATCTADGTMLFTCTVSGCDATKEEPISASGHTEEIIPAVDATCTDTGLTEGKKCSVCGEILVAQTVTEELGHSFTNYVSNNDATCTADGTKTAKCDRCDVTDTIADVGSKLDHTPAEAVKENEVAATCTAGGSYDEVVYCSVCDTELSREAKTTDALGHSFTNYVSDNNATCTADGTKTAKCDRCDVTDTITDVGSMLDHTPAEAVKENEVAATCTTGGSYDEVVYCSVCDTELSREAKTTDALGHSFTNYVSNND